jgi:uncharacterized protein YodC (DUF2158 family)
MAFKIGGTVQLKSGGPIMTIVKIDDVDHINCMWYARRLGEFRTQVFAQAILDEVEIEEEDEDED